VRHRVTMTSIIPTDLASCQAPTKHAGTYDVFSMMGFSFEQRGAGTESQHLRDDARRAASCELSTELGPRLRIPSEPGVAALICCADHEICAALRPRSRLGSGARAAQLASPRADAYCLDTAQILGQLESCETITSNIFGGRVHHRGEQASSEISEDRDCGDEIKNSIIASDGSAAFRLSERRDEGGGSRPAGRRPCAC
jgi:hypothetical protein